MLEVVLRVPLQNAEEYVITAIATPLQGLWPLLPLLEHVRVVRVLLNERDRYFLSSDLVILVSN